MTLKTVAGGALLVVSLFGTPGALADNDNEIGRYTIVPMPGHDAVILLDTKTGQNWLSAFVELDIYVVDKDKLKKKVTVKNLTWEPNSFAKVLPHYDVRAGKLEPEPGSVYLPPPPDPKDP